MKAPSFPASVVTFHAVALAFFGGCAAWLVLESGQLAGHQRLLERAVAVVSGALAALALRALVVLTRARATVPLRSRAEADSYFHVLLAVGALAVVGLRLLVLGGRPALVTFSLGCAAWLLAIGFHLVPALLLAQDAVIDHLGRRTAFSSLEWFTLQPAPAVGDEPPRALLRAGRGQVLHLRARLDGADAEPVRQALLRAKVPARPPR